MGRMLDDDPLAVGSCRVVRGLVVVGNRRAEGCDMVGRARGSRWGCVSRMEHWASRCEIDRFAGNVCCGLTFCTDGTPWLVWIRRD
jgi:hypothetical protein